MDNCPRYEQHGKKDHSIIISSIFDDCELTELASDDLSFKYDISWSPDGKWICYCYMEMEKIRPESTLWEADFVEIKEKLLK